MLLLLQRDLADEIGGADEERVRGMYGEGMEKVGERGPPSQRVL